jgi:hypothetical protein
LRPILRSRQSRRRSHQAANSLEEASSVQPGPATPAADWPRSAAPPFARSVRVAPPFSVATSTYVTLREKAGRAGPRCSRHGCAAQDIQQYAYDLCFLPPKAIEINRREPRWERISRKTAEDGYVQVMKAIFGEALPFHRLQHSFSELRIKWPSTAKPSVKRERLDARR